MGNSEGIWHIWPAKGKMMENDGKWWSTRWETSNQNFLFSAKAQNLEDFVILCRAFAKYLHILQQPNDRSAGHRFWCLLLLAWSRLHPWVIGSWASWPRQGGLWSDTCCRVRQEIHYGLFHAKLINMFGTSGTFDIAFFSRSDYSMASLARFQNYGHQNDCCKATSL